MSPAIEEERGRRGRCETHRGGRDSREVYVSPGAPGALDAGSGRKEPPRMQPCPLLDFRPWERIRFCVSTAHTRSSVAAAPGLQYSPSWRKLVSSPPKASGSSEATTVSGHLYGQRGTGTLAAVVPSLQKEEGPLGQALLGGASRPLSPPTDLHCLGEGNCQTSRPRQKGQPGGGGPVVSARGLPHTSDNPGSDPS